MRKWMIVAAIVVIGGAMLGFTSPGHRLLNTLGIATAGCETCN